MKYFKEGLALRKDWVRYVGAKPSQQLQTGDSDELFIVIHELPFDFGPYSMTPRGKRIRSFGQREKDRLLVVTPEDPRFMGTLPLRTCEVVVVLRALIGEYYVLGRK